MFLSVVDMDGCSVDVVSGTACTLRRVQDLDVGAAVRAHSLGVIARQEELVAWRGLQDRHLSHRGRRSLEERRARDSLADCQSHGMYLANLIVRLWLRTGRSSTPAKLLQALRGSGGAGWQQASYASRIGSGDLIVTCGPRIRVRCTPRAATPRGACEKTYVYKSHARTTWSRTSEILDNVVRGMRGGPMCLPQKARRRQGSSKVRCDASWNLCQG
jgi:hypothetical protein